MVVQNDLNKFRRSAIDLKKARANTGMRRHGSALIMRESGFLMKYRVVYPRLAEIMHKTRQRDITCRPATEPKVTSEAIRIERYSPGMLIRDNVALANTVRQLVDDILRVPASAGNCLPCERHQASLLYHGTMRSQNAR